MSPASLLFLICVLATLGALQLIGNPKPTNNADGCPPRRSVWSITLSTPALLVPTLFASLAAWILLGPFGPAADPSMARSIPWLGIMSLLVAGYVGLLDALYRHGRADGAHFWTGIKQHTLTFLLANGAIWGFGILIARNLRPLGTMTPFLYLAPSLLLAPLLGTAARHPRRPFHALRAAIDRTWDLHTTSRLVLYQVFVMLALWIALSAFTDGYLDVDRSLRGVAVLAHDSSALSFNTFPWFSIAHAGLREPWIAGLCGGVSMFFSSVFMHLHFRRVLQRPLRLAS